jgi:hypothetical protein
MFAHECELALFAIRLARLAKHGHAARPGTSVNPANQHDASCLSQPGLPAVRSCDEVHSLSVVQQTAQPRAEKKSRLFKAKPSRDHLSEGKISGPPGPAHVLVVVHAHALIMSARALLRVTHP